VPEEGEKKKTKVFVKTKTGATFVLLEEKCFAIKTVYERQKNSVGFSV
jgi:hypothetical protein